MKRIKVLFAALSAIRESRIFEPLGIECLMGQLKQTIGKQISLDAVLVRDNRELAILVEKIEKDKPDILGLSLFFNTLDFLNTIMDKISSMPAADRPLVVLGNILATYNSNFLLSQYPHTVVCMGSGELAMVGLVDHLLVGRRLKDVPNIAYWDSHAIQYTKRCSSLIAKPWRWFMGDIKRTNGRVYIETSRGCPHNCNFCGQGKFFGHKRSEKPIEQIKEEILDLTAGEEWVCIDIVDEDMAANPKQAKELAEMVLDLKENGLLPPHTTLMGSLSVKSVLFCASSQSLELLRKAGLTRCFLGVESGSPSQLKRYGKAHSIAEAKAAISLLRQLEVVPEIGFIMFDPEVSMEEIRGNITFCQEMKIEGRISNVFHQLRPLEGTALCDHLKESGLLVANSYDARWLTGDSLYQDPAVAKIVEAVKKFESGIIFIETALKRIYRSNLFESLPLQQQAYVIRYKEGMNLLFLELLRTLISNRQDNFDAILERSREEHLKPFLNSMLENPQIRAFEDLEQRVAFELANIHNPVLRMPLPQDLPKRSI